MFREKGLDITYRQAREPMGLLKVDHIRAILEMDPVREQFERKYGRSWNEADVRELYAGFETHLFASLKDFTTPIPGVVETLEGLRPGHQSRVHHGLHGGDDGHRASLGCRPGLCGGQPGDAG